MQGPPGLRELHMQHKYGRGALLPEMVVVLMPHSPEVLLGSPYCQTTKNVCMDQAKPRWIVLTERKKICPEQYTPVNLDQSMLIDLLQVQWHCMR